MADAKYYIVLKIEGDRETHISIFKEKKLQVEAFVRPPMQLSEELWKLLTRTISAKDVICAVGYVQEPEKGSYSTIRTLLSIINTLGIVEGVPVVKLEPGESISELEAYKENRATVQEISATYN